MGNLLAESEARLGNWFMTDIEKIIREAVGLSPSGGVVKSLPGECFHDVGQNTKAASSIGATQHTQITRASAEDFPLMKLQNQPHFVKELKGHVDLVQVGDHEDSFFLQIRTPCPDANVVLQLLVDLRMHLMRQFGRASVDFHVGCYPMASTYKMTCLFIVNMAPVAVMTRADHPDGGQEWFNPDLQSFSREWNIPVQTVDCSQGKGNMLVYDQDCWDLALTGRRVLGRLYDFNRKPGARRVTADFLKEKVAFIDPYNGKSLESWEIDKAQCPLECPLMTWVPT